MMLTMNLPSADNNEFCPSLLGSGLRLAYPTWGIFSLNTAIGNWCPSEVGDHGTYRAHCSVNYLLRSSSFSRPPRGRVWAGAQGRSPGQDPTIHGREEGERLAESKWESGRVGGRIEAYVKGRRQEEVAGNKITREHIVKAQNKAF